MKTKHLNRYASSETLGRELSAEMYAHGMKDSRFRIIRMGAGLVVLPDTDTTKDATEGEVIKALGLRGKVEPLPAETEGKRTTYSVCREGEFRTMVALTEAQIRFLRWCQSEDLFWDEIDFTRQDRSVVEI